MEIKWTDKDPETGERSYLKAEKFAGEWSFFAREQRRDVQWRRTTPKRHMWEIVLENLERRYRRREGVSDEDIDKVRRVLREWRDPPGANG